VLFYNFQPAIIQKAFLFFQCSNLYRQDTPEYYLTSDYSIQCFTASHFSWIFGVGIPILALWGVFVPLHLANEIRKNKEHLEDDNVTEKYGFLYRGYTVEKCYWEFAIMFRKFLLIGAFVFLAMISAQLQIFFITVIIIAALMVQVKNDPNAYSELNLLEERALISALTISMTMIYFILVGSVEYLDMAMVIVCSIVTLSFVIMWLKQYIWLNLPQKVKDKLLKKAVAPPESTITTNKDSIDYAKLKSQGDCICVEEVEMSVAVSLDAYSSPSNDKFRNKKDLIAPGAVISDQEEVKEEQEQNISFQICDPLESIHEIVDEPTSYQRQITVASSKSKTDFSGRFNPGSQPFTQGEVPSDLTERETFIEKHPPTTKILIQKELKGSPAKSASFGSGEKPRK